MSGRIRRFLNPEIPPLEMVELHIEGGDVVRIPAASLRDVAAALMPLACRDGSVSLTFYPHQVTAMGPAFMETSTPVTVTTGSADGRP